jgi:hypothetical protein
MYIIDNLKYHLRLNATDPRDKIFSLLGIAADGRDTAVDYTLSTWDVYTEFVKSQSHKLPLEIMMLFAGSGIRIPDQRPVSFHHGVLIGKPSLATQTPEAE